MRYSAKNLHPIRWMAGLVSLAMVAGGPLGPTGAAAQTRSGVSAGATGAVVNLGGGTTRVAAATLPAGSGMDAADLDSFSGAGALTSGWMTTTATGATSAETASSQATSAVENVDILNGLISAKLVTAVASSTANGSRASSNALGSVFTDLSIRGVRVAAGDFLASPNTRMDLPGVGFVILNEQMTSGDGIRTSGIVVNLIHVVLQDSLTGVRTGELVVGSASSTASF